MEIAKHKIVEMGRSSLIVVPKWWIESKKLNKGDKIALLKEDSITLIPERELLECSFNPAKGVERQ